MRRFYRLVKNCDDKKIEFAINGFLGEHYNVEIGRFTLSQILMVVFSFIMWLECEVPDEEDR